MPLDVHIGPAEVEGAGEADEASLSLLRPWSFAAAATRSFFRASFAATASETNLVEPSAWRTGTLGLLIEPNLRPRPFL